MNVILGLNTVYWRFPHWSRGANSEKFAVVKYARADFKHQYGVNDIAILMMEDEVQYSQRISPICLPSSSVPSLIDANNCYAAGWGTTGIRTNLILIDTFVNPLFPNIL